MEIRKKNRLSGYDYGTSGAYFITVCVQDMKRLLWADVGATIGRRLETQLSAIGEIVEEAIQNIPNHYPSVSVDKYVIMPNHIHLLLQIHNDFHGRPMVAPTISTVMQQMKGFVTKQIGTSIWQRSYYDHIIRDEEDYLQHIQYIEENPAKWENDEYY